ncbi:AAA family ATPase, partial [Streptomyces atriruber]|uniref:AAA family ATPase n=1 Tax=Streptomyces atriruber TaxID=545121 RepID=UPI0012FF0B05
MGHTVTRAARHGAVGLVERAEELAALRSAYEDAADTRGSLVVLGGAVGTGKTALLRAWTERVAPDALVLTGTACRAERELPLGVLEQLVRGCPELPAATVERTLAWCDEAASAPPVTDSPVPTSPALRGLCEALRRLVAERPVLIAVDDAHHADAASLRCLLYVVRRLRSARLHVLFTEYVHQKAGNALLGSEFLHEPALRRIGLEPLSKAGVEAVLARQLDEETAKDLTPVVHGMSAGRPLLVRALADDHRSTGRVGEAFGRAALGFLYRHEAPVTEVARAVAVLGEQADPDLVGRLLDVDAAGVARAVHQLTVAEVLHEGRLCHPAFGAAVLDGMPTEERRALHGRVAALLHEEGAPADEVAAHLVAADRSDTPWAVPVFEEAARLALEDDRVETGVGYLRAAHQRCEGPEQRNAIVGALADAEWRLDPAKVLRHLPDRAPAPA